MLRSLLAAVIVALVAFLSWNILARTGSPTASTSAPADSVSYTNATEDSIFVTSPKPGAGVRGSMTVLGYARGNWFFEASFPVEVQNAAGVVIGQSHGQANADWMTDAFVPFTAEIDLRTTYTGPATVILKNDNPSGDPSRDASLSFPVVIE